MAMRQSNVAYKTSTQVRPNIQKLPSKRAKHSPVRMTLLSLLLICSLSAALIYGKVELSEQNTQLMQKKQAHQELQNNNARLEAALSNQASLKLIEERAREMGLVELQQNQVENIVVLDNNHVEVTQGQNGWGSWWEELLAYFNE